MVQAEVAKYCMSYKDFVNNKWQLLFVVDVLLHNLETDTEGVLVFIPIGSKHFETAYLGG